MKPIAILGAGAWGTALALYLARRGQVVKLWSIETEQIEDMASARNNRQYLNGFSFPNALHPEPHLEKVAESDTIIIAVPSVGFRGSLLAFKKHLRKSHRFLCVTKGMDIEKACLLHETAHEILGNDIAYAVLSGPSFATEVARGLPTAVVIASHDKNFAQEMQHLFHSEIFRIELSTDVTGVEIGSIIKNVVAIGAGISDGLLLGANARSALITRGFKEMIFLGTALGATPETFFGLAGLGDLILTCMDDLSRNRRYGIAIGQGLPKADIEKQIGHAIEGIRNAELVIQLAQKHHIQLPLCETIYAILREAISVNELAKAL